MPLSYDEVTALHGHDPDWVKLQQSHYFEDDLRRALAGAASSFRELAIYAPKPKVQPQIMRALWIAGAPVRPHRKHIRELWKKEAGRFVRAFGADLDAFFRDAGFGAGRLPNEFDVWRGGSEPVEEMARGRSWTYRYAAACAFALNQKLWRNARDERRARKLGHPEPLVLRRRLKREHVIAWIGGVEREVILSNEALTLPAEQCGSLSEWRRRRARKEEYV